MAKFFLITKLLIHFENVFVLVLVYLDSDLRLLLFDGFNDNLNRLFI
jgi:hypothetical protein